MLEAITSREGKPEQILDFQVVKHESQHSPPISCEPVVFDTDFCISGNKYTLGAFWLLHYLTAKTEISPRLVVALRFGGGYFDIFFEPVLKYTQVN